MATKKRPADEDEDDEEEERPRRRKSKRSDDEEDEDRPRKRRPAREEDDDEPPRKKRKGRDEDDDEEEEEDKKPAKSKKGKEDENDPYQIWVRKKNVKRQQLLDGEEGMKAFRKRTSFYLSSLMGFVVTGGITGLLWFLLGRDIGQLGGLLVGLDFLFFALGIPLQGIVAAKKSFLGPPKIEGNGILSTAIMVNAITMVLFALAVAVFFLLEVFNFTTEKLDLEGGGGIAFVVLMALFSISYFFTFIIELNYFQAFAAYLKNKEIVQWTKAARLHFYAVFFAGIPVVAFASYFLAMMALVGPPLIGVLALVWLLLYFKGFMDMAEVNTKVCLAITKKIAALDKPEW